MCSASAVQPSLDQSAQKKDNISTEHGYTVCLLMVPKQYAIRPICIAFILSKVLSTL